MDTMFSGMAQSAVGISTALFGGSVTYTHHKTGLSYSIDLVWEPNVVSPSYLEDGQFIKETAHGIGSLADMQAKCEIGDTIDDGSGTLWTVINDASNQAAGIFKPICERISLVLKTNSGAVIKR